MATIRCHAPDAFVILTSPHRVGSLPDSELHLTHPSVSAQHAVITRRNGVWLLHDLDSRNGTFVNGRLLEHGEYHPLAVHDRIDFGDASAPWTVVDLDPPGMMAVRDDGLTRVADAGSLALPSPEDPQVQVFASGTTWWVEHDDETWPFTGRGTVRVAGHTWRLLCPLSDDDTTPNSRGSLTLRKVTLRLVVNRDNTFIRLVVMPKGREPVDLGNRPYNHMLVVLAEERIKHREGRSSDEAGWLRRDDLVDELDVNGDLSITESVVNIHAFNAKRELREFGVVDANKLIERRKARRPGERNATPEIRLGTDAVEIVRDGAAPSTPVSRS